MSKKEYNDMVDKKLKSREESIKKFEKAREDFDTKRKTKEKSTKESLEKQREEFYKKIEKKKSGGSVKKKFKDNPEDRFGKYRSTTAKKGKMIKADELDDELGSPPGAENYQKMFDQPESMGGDPKKRIMPKKKPKEFKKKDAPVAVILEKETVEYINKPKKKSKGGMIIGKGADYIKDLI